jgi:hypothetical protein
VRRGQVEVSDFKSGQIAQILPGQAATAFAHGKNGFSLSGSGRFNPIEQGKPRASSIERVPVPKSGLSAPRRAANSSFIHALGHLSATKIGAAPIKSQRLSGDRPRSQKGMRVSAPLGEVRLNFQIVTQGLAHGAVAPGSGTNKDLGGSDSKVSGNAADTPSGNVAGNGAAASPSGFGVTSAGASTVAVVTGPINRPGNGDGGIGKLIGKGNAKH